MKQKLIKSAAFILILCIAIFTTWRITMSNLSISISEDTAHITSFGQTDLYDYDFCNDNPIQQH